MILLIDNYDSFTYNLLHYLGELGADVVVKRNDALSVEQAMALKPEAIVISPGPCTPDEAGICVELIKAAAGKIPVLGVCLGHQSLAQAFGGTIIRGDEPVHGKVYHINTTQEGIFAHIPKKFAVTRYHSLIVEKDSLPDCFTVTAHTDDGVIMAIQHNKHALFGVQFHPESIASEHGHDLLKAFLEYIK